MRKSGKTSLLLMVAASALAAPAAARDTGSESAPVSISDLDRCPAEGAPTTRWLGIGQLQGGKGYVATPMGQVHYRLTGPADGPVIVLLHQTPWSMLQYAQIQNCLAESGIRALAIDTPGYGLSDHPEGKPSLREYAANIVPVLDALGIDRAVVAGHHTGAGIAIAFGAQFPDRTAGLLLQGTPVYTDEERAQRIAGSVHERELSADGTHLSSYYSNILDYVGRTPGTEVTATWSTLFWYLAGVADVAHDAVFAAPSMDDLRSVRAPVMIFSDAGDSLAANDHRAAGMRPWFRLTEFSEGGSHGLMLQPARWARLAAEYVRQVEDGSAPAPDPAPGQ